MSTKELDEAFKAGYQEGVISVKHICDALRDDMTVLQSVFDHVTKRDERELEIAKEEIRKLRAELEHYRPEIERYRREIEEAK